MFGNIGKEIEQLFGKVDAVFSLVGALGKDMTDVKATIAVMQRDLADGKAVWAEVRALTGHTATAITVATTTPLTSGITPAAVVPVVAQSASTPQSPVSTPPPVPGIQAELSADVAGVNPLGGVKLP